MRCGNALVVLERLIVTSLSANGSRLGRRHPPCIERAVVERCKMGGPCLHVRSYGDM